MDRPRLLNLKNNKGKISKLVKEILSLIGKLMDKYGNTLLLAFVAGILTISKAPKDWINMLPFGTQNIYWGLAVCVVAYILIINYSRHAYRSFKGNFI